MRKLSVLIVILTLLLVSCSTTVELEYSVPSEVDMGSYRNVAVASCVPLKGLKDPRSYIRGLDIDADIYTSVRSGFRADKYTERTAEVATETIESALLATGFFNVSDHSVADTIVEKSRRGEDVSALVERYNIDAIVIPKLNATTLDEAIGSDVRTTRHLDKNGNAVVKEVVEYTLYQEVSISMSITVIDARTMKILAIRKFTDLKRRESRLTSPHLRGDDPVYLAEKIIRSFAGNVARTLAPHVEVERRSLMKNSPKVERAKEAYRLAKDGMYESAISEFEKVFEEYGHIPSAYNAALLHYSLGDVDEAMEILARAQEMGENPYIAKLLDELEGMNALTERAEEQMKGLPSDKSSSTSLNIFDLVMDS